MPIVLYRVIASQKSSRRLPLFQPVNFAGRRHLATTLMMMIMISMMMMMIIIIITVLSFIYIMYLFGIIHVIAHKSSPKHVRHGCFDFFIITNQGQSKIDIVFANLTRSTDLITTRERPIDIYSGSILF